MTSSKPQGQVDADLILDLAMPSAIGSTGSRMSTRLKRPTGAQASNRCFEVLARAGRKQPSPKRHRSRRGSSLHPSGPRQRMHNGLAKARYPMSLLRWLVAQTLRRSYRQPPELRLSARSCADNCQSAAAPSARSLRWQVLPDPRTCRTGTTDDGRRSDRDDGHGIVVAGCHVAPQLTRRDC